MVQEELTGASQEATARTAQPLERLERFEAMPAEMLRLYNESAQRVASESNYAISEEHKSLVTKAVAD